MVPIIRFWFNQFLRMVSTWKVRHILENFFNWSLLRMFWKNDLHFSDEKRMFWVFEKSIFNFLKKKNWFFWLTNLRPFSGNARQALENCSTQKFVIDSILKLGFKATLTSKDNVLGFRKWHFSPFCNFFEWQSWNH